MPHPEDKHTAEDRARLADFLQTLTMMATGEYPMPVVEAIADREDARTVESADEHR